MLRLPLSEDGARVSHLVIVVELTDLGNEHLRKVDGLARQRNADAPFAR